MRRKSSSVQKKYTGYKEPKIFQEEFLLNITTLNNIGSPCST
jgi:hypothetical protein